LAATAAGRAAASGSCRQAGVRQPRFSAIPAGREPVSCLHALATHASVEEKEAYGGFGGGLGGEGGALQARAQGTTINSDREGAEPSRL
jgi:hypothetical protein